MRIFLLCLLFLAPAAAVAQTSESDRGFIQGILEDALSAPGREVRLEGFAGALSSRATIDEITVTDPDGVWFTARGVGLSWNRSALLRGRVEIEEISVEEIALPRLPLPSEGEMPAPEASGGGAFSLPELPVSVQIDEMRIDRAILGEPLFGEAAEMAFTGSAQLAGGAGETRLEVRRLDREGSFTVDAAFDNASRELALDLDLSEPENGIAANLLELPDRPSVALSVEGNDPISNFTADILLATAGEERLSGQVRLGSSEDGAASFAADLSGDIAPVFAPQFREFLGRDVALVASGQRRASGAMSLDALRVQAAAMTIEGEARIAADGWPESFNLDAEITPPQGDTVILPLPGDLTSVAGASLTATFDASAGDVWSLNGAARGYQQASLSIERVAFDGTGTIKRDDQSVTGGVSVNAEGIAPADAALARAIGAQVRGALNFGWANGAPLRLRDIALTGADYGLTGSTVISGLQAEAPLTIAPDVTLAAENLGRFADLAGVALTGAAELAITGRIEPLTGVIDLVLDGATDDLGAGIAQLDPLLEGEGVLRLGVLRNEDGLRADPLTIRTDHASITGMANLRTGTSSAELTARVPDLSRAVEGFEGAAEITAQLAQDGDVWSITADALLPGETTASYRGSVTGDGQSSLVVAGEAAAVVQRLSAYTPLAGRTLSGAANLTLEGQADVLAQSFDLTVEGALRDPRFGVPQAEALLPGLTRIDLSAEGAVGGTITIREAVIDGQEIDARVTGGFGPETGDVAFDLTIADLGLALPDLSGPAELTGTAQRRDAVWQIDTEASLPGGTGASYSGTISGDGETSLLITGRAEARVAELGAFSGLAGRDLGGAASVTLEGRGDIVRQSFDLTASGNLQSPRFGVPVAEGLLRGTTAFDLSAAGEIGDEITIRRAVIVGDQLQANVSGAFGPRTGDLTYRIAVADLGVALPDLPGPASVTGTAQRDDAVWQVAAEANLPGDTGARFDGTITGDGQTELRADGRLEARIARLDAFSPLAGRALGGAISVTAQGSVDALAGSFDIAADGTVTSPVFGVPTVEPLLRGTSRFDVNVARGASGALTFRNLVFDGQALDLRLDGGFGGGSSSLSYRVAVADLGILVPDLPGPATLSGTADQQGDRWRIDASGTGPGGIQLAARGSVAQDFSRLDVSTEGRVPLALANRRLQGQALSGFVSFNLAVNGPPALSSVSGRLSLANARLALPAQNIAVTGITGQADLAGAQARLALTGNISSGGQLRISGPIALEAPYTADLVAELANVTLRDAALYEAQLGGRVTLSGPLAGGARIGGAIDIATAELRIPDIGPSYSALDGLRHINPPADVRQTLRFAGLEPVDETANAIGPDYPLDLLVRAPNRIFVRGRGLDAELGGSLRLTGSTNDIVPIGSFSLIRGRLDLLGNRLTLTQGDVQIRGSFDPVVAFAATTQVGEVDVTLRLDGLASAPDLTVTADPDLPEEEALSLLLFGQDVTSISAFQAVQLASAIRTLSGQGGLGLTGTLREGLGVDDLDIATDAEGNTEASVGTYISERVYTDVTVSSDGTSEINLNLDLTDDVTVRGRLGNDGDTGLGIFYERDY
ncbi:MAG: translocation/assembly module TamB domain-containing protein [Marinovum algicola]|uniref:Autotransporter secretion inner membrane protein TamB n=1 Tax=Marinovum algicola TaxID=42444 RepID=A0A975WEM1_9RHOB|nr:translocation/assembly module TamB domain-containing protein [Marinovum algicola]SEK08179.1 autotransporter secretion inner membrane protein TamB [Marinovum algicola]SLN76610.1 Translocation and assembly module TamB [Marinovum algicola]